jgi:pimeloyl-ACP methyl ester carboxylesterase
VNFEYRPQKVLITRILLNPFPNLSKLKPRQTNRARSDFTCARVAIVLLLILTFLMGACGPRRTPDLMKIFQEARATRGKRPLIVIPGILGSQLVNSKTGVVEWPSVFQSGSGSLSLPISPDLKANRDDLVPEKIIDTLKLSRLVPEVFVYHELLQALKNYGGYQEGDWDNPGTDGDHDRFYVFAYDWRRDNVENARLLIRKVRSLKDKLGRRDLRFNVVAHSMGGLIARYAAEYGDQDLPGEGVAPHPNWNGAADIQKILMFGTPNEGSADAFATLLEGYSITEGLRARLHVLNKLSREHAYTAPSLFQLLPHQESAIFLNQDLTPMKLDLYDEATWKKYGWTAIFDGRGVTEKPDRIEQKGVTARNEELVQREEYLAAVLNRARAFHLALDAPLEISPPVTFLAFGGDCEETLNSPAIITGKSGRWITLTEARSLRSSSGRQFTKREVVGAMYAPGDGRVTRRSLLATDLINRSSESEFVRAGLPFSYTVFACGLHGDLQNNKNLQDNALTALVGETIR